MAFTTDERELESFEWYVGWPIRASKGAVWVTGLEFRRIGPSTALHNGAATPTHARARTGVCNKLNDKHELLVDRIDALEAGIAVSGLRAVARGETVLTGVLTA